MWIASRFGKQTFPAWLFLLSNRALFPTYLWSQSVFSCDPCMCITLKIFAKWNSRVHRFTEWFFLASDFLEEAKSGRKQWSPLWGWHKELSFSEIKLRLVIISSKHCNLGVIEKKLLSIVPLGYIQFYWPQWCYSKMFYFHSAPPPVECALHIICPC